MLVSIAKQFGLHRIGVLHYLFHRFLCRDPHQLNMPNKDLVLETDGQKFWVGNPRKSFIGRSIFFHGTWEEEATEFIRPKIREGMTIVDVGAHTGYYTLLFAKRAGASGRVISVEPEETGLDFLRRSVALNGHRNVTVVEGALSNAPGQVSDTDRRYCRQVGESGSGVKAERFDELLTRLEVNHVDLVKIDVEGAELHVLEGMGNMAPTSILLEIHPQGLAACGRSEDELRAFLHQAGYTGQTVVEPKTSDVYTTYWTRTQ